MDVIDFYENKSKEQSACLGGKFYLEIRISRFAMCVELINSVSYSYGMEFFCCGRKEFSFDL